MSDLRLHAEVTADGKAATEELKKVTGSLASAKVELAETARAAKEAQAAYVKHAKSTDATSASLAALKATLIAAREAEIGAAAGAREAQTAFDAQTQAARRNSDAVAGAARSAAAMRSSSAQLGFQINDITQSIALGVSPMTIFAQQAGQTAFALSGMGGAVGKVAAFLSGPWGAAVLGGVTVLAALGTAFFDTGESAKTAAKAAGEFEKRQADIGNFIDATTGKLKEQNATLLRNAILLRQAKIEKNSTEIQTGTKAAFDSLATVGRGVQQVNPRTNRLTTKFFDADIAAAVKSAAGDIVKLDEALAKVAARRPDLRETIRDISDSASATILLARENKKAAEEIDKLTGKTKAHTVASASLIEKQVALATATTALERARARYALVEADGEAATKGGAAAVAAYRARLTEAANAVNAAEAAEKAAREGRRETTKGLNEAAKAAKKYAAELDAIYEAGRRGANALLTANDMGSIVADLQRANDAPVNDRLSELTKDADERNKNYYAAAGTTTGKAAARAFEESATAAASVIGQIIGGKAGSKIQSAVQVIGSAGSTPAGAAFTAAFTKANKDSTDALLGLFGKGGEKFAGALGTSFAYASQGAAASALGGALGIKQGSLGASLGGAAGGAIGNAILPGIGGAIGSALGGLLGGSISGLLGKPQKSSSTLSFGANGYAQSGVTGTTADLKATATGLTGSLGSVLQSIADQLGGAVRNVGAISLGVGSKGGFVVDFTGTGKTKTGNSFKTQEEALSVALAELLKRGAVTASPAVQTALQRYATDVNKAVAEALKVKGLEDLLAEQDNPFRAAFRDFEEQAKARLKVATDYGFKVAEIEKLNADERAKLLKSTLASATQSAQALLDDFRFGSRATGSVTEQIAALSAERDRLAGLVRAGDTGSLEAVTAIVQQIDDLQRQAFGATGPAAAGRDASVSILQELVKATEDRINAAAREAAGTAEKTVAKLTEANASLDDQVALLARIEGGLARLPAAIAAAIGGGTGGLRDTAYRRVLA